MIIEWSKKAENDLYFIFKNIKEISFSDKTALNVVNDIYDKGNSVNFAEQYQIDEFAGKPYRRIIVRDYKIIYKAINANHIRILQIFNTFQSPSKLHK